MEQPGMNLNATDLFAPPACQPPLLEESIYENSTGYIQGRYCGVGANSDGTVCCFPCPIQDWVYPSTWKAELKAANYLSILSLILCIFLLLSFAVLPPEKTHRHYLSVGLLFPVLFISLSFIIPVSYDPPLCSDDITPNDMHSSLSCAFTGAFVALGVLGSVVWVFLRSLWLHIRIFWDRDPGAKFKCLSITAGTALPLVFLTALLAATGVSYRMGLTCLPNHPNAIESFWIWLVLFAIAAFILQAVTTGYCMWVFMRAVKRERAQISQASLDRTSTANEKVQTWRHVKKLFLLQWRNILVSIFVIIGSISFFIVFWSQDAKLGGVWNDPTNQLPVRIWITCLILSEGNKESCLQHVKGFTVPRQTVLASLILASLVGIEIFVLLARVSMFSAWRDFFTRPFPRFQRRPPSPMLTSFANPPPHFHEMKAAPFTSAAPNSISSSSSDPDVVTINRTDSTRSRFQLGILKPVRSQRRPREGYGTRDGYIQMEENKHAAPEVVMESPVTPISPTTPPAPPTSPSYIPTNPPSPPLPPVSVSSTLRLGTALRSSHCVDSPSPSHSLSSSPSPAPPSKPGTPPKLHISSPVPGSFTHIATGFPPQRIETKGVGDGRPPSPTLGRGRSVRNVRDLPGWAREREEKRVEEEMGQGKGNGNGTGDRKGGEEGEGRIVGRGGLGMNPLW